ncbi:MAG: 3-hydroxyacyl-[acyl-carrier-protein] dehydratase FabZ [Rickettsiales bacterium]|nr:3-hydroxyacyl-[acyl-carrier-protein] dehydratase FabZ [Rickettsiales bacterium]|tara:strand:- start:47765 stop:48235 length:471 start_codon:yes stop_codon:yes gene_type:complete
MSDPKILNYNEIVKLIPHRYPMLLVDQVHITELHEEAVGIKNVTINESFFQGHFPEQPIMPGVLIIEALAQTSGILVMYGLAFEDSKLKPEDAVVYFMSIANARFVRPVLPGHRVELRVKSIQRRGMVWKFKGQAYVDDELCAEAEYKAMIAEKKS